MTGGGPVDPSDCVALGLPAADETVLRLGGDHVALVRCAAPGDAYPADSRSDDLWFQHLAIVVSDIDAAFAQVTGSGARPISADGPSVLPPRNGAVRAFKFRDPDGHPLELIWFPPGQGRAAWQKASGLFLGIDHSALAVSSAARSVRFYHRLGLRVASRSANRGPAQSALDGLPGADARVIGLRDPWPRPGAAGV